jgi:predicted dehydrogenase
MSVTRREFLKTSTASVLTAGAASRSAVWGANDRIGVCVVGFNGQGGSHIREILRMEEAEIVALCDVDSQVLEKGIEAVKAAKGNAPKAYRDVREVMADKTIDAVTTATPNHWHAAITVWGCQAGKDVYVEKPMSHSAFESRQCVAAAKKFGRIVQHGTQARVSPRMIRDMALIHDGFIGKIVHSRGVVYKNGNRNAIGHGAPGPVPPYLDWTLWQGPAREKPFLINKDRQKPGLFVHYDWHWFWEYGNGEIGNQGVHEMDVACWAHNRGKPVKVSSTGGRYGWDDDAETPNTQATQFTYADGSMMTFEVRNLGSFYEGGEEAGASTNSVFGETGYWVRNRGFFDYQNKPMVVEKQPPEGRSRFAHFFAAVRSRKPEDLVVSVEDAHIACLHCQIGNIAYRIGHTLIFDPASEKFTDCDAANAMLKRDYRDGFAVPEIV